MSLVTPDNIREKLIIVTMAKRDVTREKAERVVDVMMPLIGKTQSTVNHFLSGAGAELARDLEAAS